MDDFQFDETEDWLWCESQYAAICQFVQDMQIPHGEICDWPEWFTAPYVGLWVVEDVADPGFAGYWIIAGDASGEQANAVPFDYLPAVDLIEPQQALAAFAKRWQQLATTSSRWTCDRETGTHLPRFGGAIAQLAPAEQALHLLRQAQLLQQWAADAELWQDD